jgi:hypothetical protein
MKMSVAIAPPPHIPALVSGVPAGVSRIGIATNAVMNKSYSITMGKNGAPIASLKALML